jgi:hypothetical protein
MTVTTTMMIPPHPVNLLVAFQSIEDGEKRRNADAENAKKRKRNPSGTLLHRTTNLPMTTIDAKENESDQKRGKEKNPRTPNQLVGVLLLGEL